DVTVFENSDLQNLEKRIIQLENQKVFTKSNSNNSSEICSQEKVSVSNTSKSYSSTLKTGLNSESSIKSSLPSKVNSKEDKKQFFKLKLFREKRLVLKINT
ncbi:hypothetical protein, partial [Brucella melitensis]|uniref:hypothetical protein n=1 Tax=Brucella melitensis TaxID=29459 RepID=UPI001AED2EC5